jgi:hypothetical protein
LSTTDEEIQSFICSQALTNDCQTKNVKVSIEDWRKRNLFVRLQRKWNGRQAQKRQENAGIDFFQASVLDQLPFEDKHFDVSITSYVAHGLPKIERKRMYADKRSVTKSKVIIYDYNL